MANRGEIALRVMRTCRELGIATVAVYSEIDRAAPHVRAADEAYPIGPAAAAASYLRIEPLVAIAKRAGCDAIHPGYGFLSENADFADAVLSTGLVFVGPPAAVQRALGEKTSARRIAARAGVPVAEGTMEPIRDEAEARAIAERVGYPVLLKPAGGGGGKGMRIVGAPAELASAWRAATGEATTAFGAPALLLERLIQPARHVEVQLLADTHGTVVSLGERDCSIQRRHQKLIEETPGPAVDDALRAKLGAAAVKIAAAAGYVNAGTAEFLVAPDGSFYFLEMNTRLQVEHPVTELVTGLDLVALQLRVAAGEPLGFGQDDVKRNGAAIELRITAEDPFANFLPQGGRIDFLREPSGPGIRMDSGLAAPLTVPTDYDPLLAKLIAWGPDRPTAIARARRAVRETIVAGLPTSLPFHSFVLGEPDFAAGRYDTDYVGTHWARPEAPELTESGAVAAALAGIARLRSTPRPVGTEAGPWVRSAREDMLR
ncbi:MAG TPA: biotin carboxylase N-terminal domain-containing protein [Candidatus Limnocylindria bacterium]|nr:biotin carboxylase N-terminal domain-containing protein [Candidatus Limnocylindria bacterium]